MQTMVLAFSWIIVILLAAIGALVVVKMWTGKIDLTYLVAEANGQASYSRFQFLVFTLVIAGSFLILTLEQRSFPTIDPSILGLRGISGGSYVLSKGIQSGSGAAMKGVGAATPSRAYSDDTTSI